MLVNHCTSMTFLGAVESYTLVPYAPYNSHPSIFVTANLGEHPMENDMVMYICLGSHLKVVQIGMPPILLYDTIHHANKMFYIETQAFGVIPTLIG